jgi:hypothetical protein
VVADDLGDDVEQLRRHRDHSLPVGLRRGDHQQRDDLVVGALELTDRQVGQLTAATASGTTMV